MAEIRTTNLILRPLVLSDVTETYVNWLNDIETNKYLETRHNEQTLQSCRDYVVQSNNSPNTHLFGIFLKEAGRHIGNAKIGFINLTYQTGHLSLFIGDKSSLNRGYATEVVRALTAHAFRHLGLKKIEASCYEENIGSLKTFLKVGYVVEGFMRSNVVFEGRRLGCFWLGKLENEHAE